MVVFVCGACGASLKKNQVEFHPYKCRGCEYVTCMDCSKEFWGNDYTSHLKCITEDQKYGGLNYVAKEFNGQKKQEAWITLVQDKINNTHNISPKLKNLFDHILQFDNIPRKKPKFMNFLTSNNYRDQYLNEDAWKFFEELKQNANQTNAKPDAAGSSSSQSVAAQAEKETEETKCVSEAKPRKSKRERKEERRNKQTKIQKPDKRKRVDEDDNEDQEAVSPKKKKKKSKRRADFDEANQENEEPEREHSGSVESDGAEELSVKQSPFKWKKAINTILEDAPEEGMKMKKFKRKVSVLYLESAGAAAQRKTDLEIDALISKKLQMRNDKYVVVKDRVKLKNPNKS